MSFDIKALEESMISFQNEDEEKAKRKVVLKSIIINLSFTN